MPDGRAATRLNEIFCLRRATRHPCRTETGAGKRQTARGAIELLRGEAGHLRLRGTQRLAHPDSGPESVGSHAILQHTTASALCSKRADAASGLESSVEGKPVRAEYTALL